MWQLTVGHSHYHIDLVVGKKIFCTLCYYVDNTGYGSSGKAGQGNCVVMNGNSSKAERVAPQTTASDRHTDPN